MALNPSETLETLKSLQSEPLSIIRLSEPISASQPATRTSDVSASAFENPSPASLEADLTHYKELFSKLRFSYLEQVTKEKFLRAIVGDPPLVVEHVENIELEAQLAEVKSVLKAQKENVAEMVTELEERGRDLARRKWFGLSRCRFCGTMGSNGMSEAKKRKQDTKRLLYKQLSSPPSLPRLPN